MKNYVASLIAIALIPAAHAEVVTTDCDLICTTWEDGFMECRTVCNTVDLGESPDIGDPDAPGNGDPGLGGSCLSSQRDNEPDDIPELKLTSVLMKPKADSNEVGSQLWPTKGRWGNEFIYSVEVPEQERVFARLYWLKNHGRNGRTIFREPGQYTVRRSSYEKKDGSYNPDKERKIKLLGDYRCSTGTLTPFEPVIHEVYMKTARVTWNNDGPLNNRYDIIHTETRHRKDYCNAAYSATQTLSFTATYSFTGEVTNAFATATLGLELSMNYTFSEVFTIPEKSKGILAEALVEEEQDIHVSRYTWQGELENDLYGTTIRKYKVIAFFCDDSNPCQGAAPCNPVGPDLSLRQN